MLVHSKLQRIAFIVSLVFGGLAICLAQEDANEGEDTSAGLPSQYSDYLVASKTLSPDKTYAIIYPTLNLCDEEPGKGAVDRCKDYLVRLKPFQVLTVLATKWPEFQNKSHGGMSAAWSPDGAAVLVTLDRKWGPGDIFLYEIHDGKLTRSIDLLKKVSDLLLPSFKKAKAEAYNGYFDFIFDDEDEIPVCAFADSTHVRVRGMATTDPKDLPGEKAWDGRVEAIWDIPQARFTAQKVKTLFAGTRPEDTR